MLGWNQNVRNVPDSSRTMNDHSAISPSMKDQCSGKTLRSGMSLLLAAKPSRSSIQATGPDAFLPNSVFWIGVYSLVSAIALVQLLLVASQFWVARRDDLLEVTQGNQVTIRVDAQRQLWQRTMGGAKDHFTRVGEVEGRLVA